MVDGTCIITEGVTQSMYGILFYCENIETSIASYSKLLKERTLGIITTIIKTDTGSDGHETKM